MDKACEICEFLKSPAHQILVTKNWSVGLGNNQLYFGRAYASLRTHKQSLSRLNNEEWQEFEEIVRKIEKAYKEVYGAEPINWGCYMNNSYRTKPFNPHVHWHIYPRYEMAPVFEGVTYDDRRYGEYYDNEAEKIVSDDLVEKIASKLRDYLTKPQ